MYNSNTKQLSKPLPLPEKSHFLHLKDPGSAITHFIGVIFALAVAGPLLARVIPSGEPVRILSMVAFLLGMLLLYGASTTYHSIDSTPRVNKALKKIDHMMIFILIAGTYTPMCTIVIGGTFGWIMLGLVWGIALIGIIIKACWIYCPKWFSSVIYIAMGWVCLIAFREIVATLSTPAFLWLLIGGIIYTIGGVLYALKLKIFNNIHPNFGSHEIFHLFCLGGTFCHFILMYQYVAFLPLK